MTLTHDQKFQVMIQPEHHTNSLKNDDWGNPSSSNIFACVIY